MENILIGIAVAIITQITKKIKIPGEQGAVLVIIAFTIIYKLLIYFFPQIKDIGYKEITEIYGTATMVYLFLFKPLVKNNEALKKEKEEKEWNDFVNTGK